MALIKDGVLDALVDISQFITLSKPVARKLGVNTAILLGELCSMSNLYGDGEFYCTMDRLVEDTCLSERLVRAGVRKLQEYGILRVTKKGVPCRNYYYIDRDNLVEKLGVMLEEYTDKKKAVIKAKGCGSDKCPLKGSKICETGCPKVDLSPVESATSSTPKSEATGCDESVAAIKKECDTKNGDKETLLTSSREDAEDETPPWEREQPMRAKPQRKSRPKSDVTVLGDTYKELFDSLRKSGRVNLVDYNWGVDPAVSSRMARAWLSKYPVERLKEALHLAAKDDWIVNETGFKYSAIMSSKVMPRLLTGQVKRDTRMAFSDGERDYSSTTF